MLESSQPTPTQRVALVIQYLGTHFHGWQRQLQHRTVQEEIEKAIATVLGHSVTLHGAGRTDSGVHAAAQVAHFEATGSSIPARKWAAILNSYLPKDILIRASASVDDRWHARFSAAYRRYRYTLYTEEQPNLFVRPFSWHYYAPLDESLMQAALKPLIGRHHLSAFHRAGSKRKHSWVEVQAAECHRSGSFIHIEIQADGFLYGMVRLLVGMLVQVGAKERSLSSFTNLWEEERRQEVKHAAPAHGLCLLRVGYPDFPFPKEVWYDTQPKFIFPGMMTGDITA